MIQRHCVCVGKNAVYKNTEETDMNQEKQSVKRASISAIRAQLQAMPVDAYAQFIAEHQGDDRSGVQALVTRAQKSIAALEAEKERIYNMRAYERKYENTYSAIAGIDEVGRGPLAGPVVACAVILPKGCEILYVNDSKQLSAAKREELYEIIMERAVGVGLGCVSHERIDEINILQATYEAMREAVHNLPVEPDLLLNDAVVIPQLLMQQVKLVHGDARSISIAAASIVAKVTRDRMMVEYDEIYPQYGFAQNKGYGSAAHMDAIRKFGPCPIHRRSFIGKI